MKAFLYLLLYVGCLILLGIIGGLLITVPAGLVLLALTFLGVKMNLWFIIGVIFFVTMTLTFVTFMCTSIYSSIKGKNTDNKEIEREVEIAKEDARVKKALDKERAEADAE